VHQWSRSSIMEPFKARVCAIMEPFESLHFWSCPRVLALLEPFNGARIQWDPQELLKREMQPLCISGSRKELGEA